MSNNKNNNKRKIESSHPEGAGADDEEQQIIMPASYKNRFAVKNMNTVVAHQKERAAGAGEFVISGTFDHYEVQREVDGKKTNVHMDVCPKRVSNDVTVKKDGKEETKKIPERLVMRIRLNGGTGDDDKSVVLPDGNIKVFAAVAFQEKADEWFTDLHNGKVQYTGKFPISEVMNDEGHKIQARWVQLNKGQIYKIKCGDSGPLKATEQEQPNVFRRTTEDGMPLVSKHVNLKFAKCEVSQYICIRKMDDGRTEPTVYTTLSCKGGVRLAHDHDPYKPLSERYHDQEDKDAHNMIPVKALANGTHISNNAYFYMKHPVYQTPSPSGKGVTIQMAPVDDLKDFYYVTKDGEGIPKVTMRAMVVQWKGSPNDPTDETYSINLLSRGDQWRYSGITDGEYFAHIEKANPIWAHCECKLWYSSVIKADANQPIIRGPTDKELRDDETLSYMQTGGYYTWEIENIVFDMGRYLPVMGLPVSRKWVEKEFSRYIGKMGEGEDERRTLFMTPPDPTKLNPLHQGSHYVISMGNGAQQNPKDKKSPPRCHGFSGDVFEAIDGAFTFYVLTSHTYTDEERRQYCGRRKDPKVVEKWIDELKATDDGIFYWIYAYNEKANEYLPVKKAKKEVVSLSPPQGEEEEEDGPQPMDELPEGEIKHEEPEPEPASLEEEEIEEEEEIPASGGEEEPEEMEIEEEEEEEVPASDGGEEEPEAMEIEEEEEEKEPTPPPSPPKKKKTPVKTKKVVKTVTKKKK